MKLRPVWTLFLVVLLGTVLGILFCFHRLRADSTQANCLSAEGCDSLGWNAFRQTDFLRASAAFQKAIDLFPMNEEAYIGMAQLFTNQPNRDDAIKVLRHFLTSHPDAYGAHAALAYLLDIQGEEADAITEYALALKGNKGTQLFFRWNRAILLAERNHFQEALEDLHWCAKESPGDWRIPFIIASIYEEMGDKEKAIRYFERSILLLFPHKDLWSSMSLDTVKNKIRISKHLTGVSLEQALSKVPCCSNFKESGEKPSGISPRPKRQRDSLHR